MQIKKIAVLGSGVMGSGIAALAANAGCEVMLLDIVPPNAARRNELAEKGIARQLAAGGFTHPGNANSVTPGNLEDDLRMLSTADWIIEAVLEKLEVKQDVYRKVDAVRNASSVVSSNTSTLPLHELISGMSEKFQQDFMIAHFFNPPRHMRLLELVKSPEMKPETYAAVKQFADVALGKQVVECKDTPGFIANRIGVFWMVVGLLEAMRLGITVEQADAVMGRPAGIPKTGVFGLYDLIGIDLIPLIAKAMMDTLGASDQFRVVYQEPALVKKMIAEGYTGRKGKGGFYRVSKQGEKKVKEVLDLAGGQYRPESEAALGSAKAKTLADLVSAQDIGGQYAWAVLSKTLTYAASLIPEISDSTVAVDEAMRCGYSWQWGPFEMIDKIGVDAFTARLQADGMSVPPLLQQAGRSLYAVQNGTPKYLTVKGAYADVPRTPGHLWLADIKQSSKPVASNASASLWDMGDGVACLELTSKMNAVDANILAFIEQSIPRIKQDFKGLVIGNDSERFSVGANLSVFLEHAKNGEWEAISDIVKRGQQAMTGLKYTPFPVAASLSGMALGGGCEIVLHADAVQAHMESTPGLVEVKVGLIPGWGGCKEMLLRQGDALRAFDLIVNAKTAASADEARDMKILRADDRVSMNRARLLGDAKARCLALVNGYQPPKPATVKAGGAAAREAMVSRLDALASLEKISPYDMVIGRVLANVLSGGNGTGEVPEQHLLDLEHQGFMELIQSAATQQRITHMLETGKPLRN